MNKIRRNIVLFILLAPVGYVINNQYKKYHLINKYSKNIISDNYREFQYILNIAMKYNENYNIKKSSLSFFEKLVIQYDEDKISSAEVKSIINRKIMSDFEKERIVFVEDWMLSVTECDLASYIAIKYN